MKYFIPKEFSGWFDQLSDVLKIKLDELRESIGVPIELSKSAAAMGRNLGDYNTSQHNVDKWGEVRAVDGYVPEGVSLVDFYNEAKGVGFTGIGFYTGWDGGRGFHLDVREDRQKGFPATWGGTYTYNPKTKKGHTDYGSIWEIIDAETIYTEKGVV